MSIYNIISGAFCVAVGVLILQAAFRQKCVLFFGWAAGLFMMAAGVMSHIWQLQAGAGALMVVSLVIDERVAARNYATHRMNLQDDAATEVKSVAVPEEEEPVPFEIKLESPGDNQTEVAKTLRGIYVLDTKDAARLTRGARPIKQFVSKQEAEYVKRKLEECGARVKIGPM